MAWTQLRLTSLVFTLLVLGCGSHTDKSGSKPEAQVAAGASGANPDAGSAAASKPNSPRGDGSAGMRAAAGSSAVSAGSAGSAGPHTPGPGADAGRPAACDASHSAVSGKCVCSLTGTFALRQRFEFMLSNVPSVEDMDDTVDYWSIVHIESGAEGKLELSIGACGNVEPEICVDSLPPAVPQPMSLAQYIPAPVWEMSDASSTAVQIGLEPLPGSAFATAAWVRLAGISLADPLGAWPATRKDIEGGSDFDGTAVNGAHWVDLDKDAQLGVTSYAVPPGGVPAGMTDELSMRYGGEKSTKCPRSDATAPRSGYGYVPATLDGSGVKRYYEGIRVISELHGSLESCDRITGKVTGQNAGQLQAEQRVGDCMLDAANATPCPAASLDVLESAAAPSPKLKSGSFVMIRVPDDAACADARAATFD